MNKIVSIKNTSAIFLAIVLIAGTIALFPTFFMVGTAQATSDHEKDYDKYDDRKSYEKNNYKSTEYQSYEKDNNSYDKSKDSSSSSSSSISVKKIKCNNINVNINGFNGIDVNVVPPALNGLATDEAQASEDEGEIGASSSGSGERNHNGYQYNDKNFRFVCINNNNFEVVETTTSTPTEPQPTCEECFTKILSPDQVDDIEFFLNTFTTIEGLEGFCDDFLTDPNISNEDKISNVGILLSFAEVFDEDTRLAVLECLEKLGLITVGSGGDRPEH